MAECMYPRLNAQLEEPTRVVETICITEVAFDKKRVLFPLFLVLPGSFCL